MDAFASNDFKCTWEWCAKLDVRWDGTQYAFDHAQIPEWFDCTEYQRNAKDDVGCVRRTSALYIHTRTLER